MVLADTRCRPLMAFGPTVNLGNGREPRTPANNRHEAAFGRALRGKWIERPLVSPTVQESDPGNQFAQ